MCLNNLILDKKKKNKIKIKNKKNYKVCSFVLALITKTVM